MATRDIGAIFIEHCVMGIHTYEYYYYCVAVQHGVVNGVEASPFPTGTTIIRPERAP